MGKIYHRYSYYGETRRSSNGKRKRKSYGLDCRVSIGQIPFEMDGVSLSNARQAARLMAHKPFHQPSLFSGRNVIS